MAPLFSIITVARNAASTIPVTLASVKDQTCPLFEYIVIDGASTDNTVELVQLADIPNTRILSEPDEGLYDAMNKGLGMATGDYVIFLNAGDSFHTSSTLQLLADTALNNDYPGVLYGQTDLVDKNGVRIGPRHLEAPELLTLESFRDGMVVCHQAFTALRKLTSNFDTTFRFSSDYDWCIRCLQHSRRNIYVGEVTINYLNEGVTTANHRASLRERFRIMSRYYGFWPTVFRHISFLRRHLRRRRQERNHSF